MPNNSAIQDYYEKQVAANDRTGNAWYHDHDGDYIVVVKKDGKYIACVPPGWVDRNGMNGPNGESLSAITIPDGDGFPILLFKYNDTPDIFQRGSDSDRSIKQIKHGADMRQRAKIQKGGKKGNNQETKEDEMNLSNAYSQLNKGADSVFDFAGAVAEAYLDSDDVPPAAVVAPTPTPVVTTQTMSEWSNTDIAIAGGAIALGIGLIYVIARK